MTLNELIKTYPGAKKTISALIAEDEATLEYNRELRARINNYYYAKVPSALFETITESIFTIMRTDFIVHEDIIPLTDGEHITGIRIKRNLSGFKRGEWVADRLSRNRRLLACFNASKKNKTDDFTSQVARAREIPITNFIQTNKQGWANCPLHEEKTPSFKITLKKNLWYCFGCHEGGDVISFIMKLNNCNFKDAVWKLTK